MFIHPQLWKNEGMPEKREQVESQASMAATQELNLLLCSCLLFCSGHSSLFPMEDGFPDDERGDQGLGGLGSPHFAHQNGERVERYSRKVFVGGLPPDIDEGIGTGRVTCWDSLPLRV